MTDKKDLQNEITALAKHSVYYTELLIKQCDSWLSEEEGVKNMEKKILKKKKITKVSITS